MSRRFRGDRLTNAQRARESAEYWEHRFIEADALLRPLAAQFEGGQVARLLYSNARLTVPPRAEILRAWATSPEAKNWGPAEAVAVCVEFPYLFSVGDGGELFAIIDCSGRVFSEDEFPGDLLCACKWVELDKGTAS